MPMLRTRIKHVRLHEKAAYYFTLAVRPPPKLTPEGDQTLESIAYSYKLEESPNYPGQQDDPVIRTIIGTIRRLSKYDIAVTAARIHVYNLTNAPPLWPVTDENADSVKFYAFKPYYSEFPISVPITLVKNCRRLDMHSILVREDGCWKPLRRWLMGLPDRNFLLSGNPRLSIRSQQRWWSVNGKIFPLMNLPFEVRIIVLQHVMGSKIYLTTVCCGNENCPRHVVQARASRSRWYDRRVPFEAFGSDTPNINALLVSRQVRMEALKATWEGTWKHFLPSTVWKVNLNGRDMHIATFCSVMTAVQPGPWNWISKIELNYSTYHWFDFFNVEVCPRVRIRNLRGVTNGKLLKQISTLKKLRLVFPSPYDESQKHPWDILLWDFYSSHGFSNTGKDEHHLYVTSTRPCFRTLVDWILTFAFPFIKHVPNIYLEGYIKTKQKDKWEDIFATEFKHRKDKEFKGFDHKGALAEIIGHPGTISLPCHCPLPCTLVEMRLESFDYNDEFNPEDDRWWYEAMIVKQEKDWKERSLLPRLT